MVLYSRNHGEGTASQVRNVWGPSLHKSLCPTLEAARMTAATVSHCWPVTRGNACQEDCGIVVATMDYVPFCNSQMSCLLSLLGVKIGLPAALVCSLLPSVNFLSRYTAGNTNDELSNEQTRGLLHWHCCRYLLFTFLYLSSSKELRLVYTAACFLLSS